MPEISFRERLRRGDTLLGDGALGTQLQARGLQPGEAPESFNLTRPEAVSEVARLYAEAGAEIVTTNTFGGSPFRLAAHGLADRTEEVNRLAVELARAAVGGRAFVAGSVGPCGHLLAPLGDVEPEEVEAGYERQIRALAAAGVDLVLIETMTDLAEATLAIRAARNVAPDLPVAATMTFDATPRGLFTVMGVSVERAAAGLAEAGADVVGSNCGCGIEGMIAVARAFRDKSALPIAIQANAGLPQRRDGGFVYVESPEFMAERVGALLDLGVRIVGGCCGTTPDHIRAFRSLIDAHRVR
jgi:5-methyltetrahydrofolate--homocysteine methyltransferase